MARAKTMPDADATPFGMDISLSVIDRSAFLAKQLLGAKDAGVILVSKGRVWRSTSRLATTLDDAPAAKVVFTTGEPLWVTDCRLDPRFADDPNIVGPPFVRFYAGAPIRLPDGSIAGVICATGPTPKAPDADKLACLEHLADGLADEWARAQASRASLEAAAERDNARSTLAELILALPLSVVMTDKNLCVAACSQIWADALHLDHRQVHGRSVFEIADGFYNRWAEPFAQALKGESFRGQRVKIPQPDGGIQFLQCEVTPWTDAGGDVAGIIVAADDVTPLVEAMKSLERNEARLNMALSLTDVHVFELDYRRRELFKAGAEDTFFMRPQTYEDLYHDAKVTVDDRDREMVEELWRRHIEDGEPYRGQYRIKRNDGKDVWVEGTADFKTDAQGRPVTLLGAIRNITDQKLAEQAFVRAKEEAEAASVAKSTFLATMSHEIRTPLNGVLGMAQVLAGEALSPAQQERVRIIQQSGQSLLAILNDLLDLAKIEAGKLTLEEAEFCLDELARGAHGAFSAVAEQKDLRFRMEIAPEAQGVYLGDSTRVRQILYNLISNALKFTETGGIDVNVTLAEPGLVFSVRDTGIGIPADRVEQLFEKFEQADTSTTRKFGGTGLGLSICRDLASLMGGSIKAESRLGEGTTFTVSLPLPRVGNVMTAEQRESGETSDLAERADQTALRVLAAEDNAVNQLVLRTMLEQAGITPTLVGDGRAAVQAWESQAWDLVLMDVQMPVMDGIAATRAIRSREAALGRARTPILALTANAMTHHVAEYLAADMDGFVAKPIEVGQLFAAMERALDGAEHQACQAATG
jgi:signal transduction histidine kinase/CheY-like chemotaxis protein